ncbi:MAG: 2-amino-4-hydroxy-6-hydroxymethyldihydropteridine diphosphokinase [Thermodesulfobacteriota bacterium]
MNRAVISVGSNIDPEENIKRAAEILAGEERLLRTSAPVRTKPVGVTGQPDFLNGAFLIETEKDADGLRASLKEIERRLGRVRSADKSGPRTMDLDIIVFNGEVIDADYFRYDFVRNAVDELRRSTGDGLKEKTK